MIFTDQDLEYQLPYYDCVPDDPSIEAMKAIVCEQKRRPLKEDKWDKYEVREKAELIEEQQAADLMFRHLLYLFSH